MTQATPTQETLAPEAPAQEAAEPVVRIPAAIVVSDLASLLSVTPVDVIKELMKNGVMATINQVVDFDTAAVGEPALDVANIFAHLELRVLQGRCSLISASQATDALLEGYDHRSDVLARLPAYRDASRLRLACVYAFRPRCSHLVTELVRRIELPHLYDVREASRDQCIEVKYPT